MDTKESMDIIISALRRLKSLELTMQKYNGIQSEVLERHQLALRSLDKMTEFASCMLSNCNAAKKILDRNIGGNQNG